MKKVFIKPAAGVVMAITMLMVSAHALAQSTAFPDQSIHAKTTHKVVKKKVSQGGKVKVLRGSEETTAERSARLKRECFGGVNAGACSGYTR